MKTIKASDAQSEFNNLIEEAFLSHRPIQIIGDSKNAILISEEDWQAIQETIHLLSIPGMRESIKDGLNTPPEDCSKELGW